MTVYPIFLNGLRGRKCVVFGGNDEAARKVRQLLECEADVRVIAAGLDPPLAVLHARGAVAWIRRRYRPGDLAGAFLTIVAETDPVATAPIYEEARAERVLINAMDDVAHCTFVAGSTLRRGPLVIAISSSGVAPALSVRLRERLEREIGPEYASFLELLGSVRAEISDRYPDFEERRRLWYQLVDSSILDHLRNGDAASARHQLAALTGIDPVNRSDARG